MAGAICLGVGVVSGGAGFFFCLIGGAGLGGYAAGLAGGAMGEYTGRFLYRMQSN